MALFLATDTFAYISLDDKILHVDGTDVTDRGPWAAATTYTPNDVVLYQNTLYVCLTGHTNMPPTSIRDDFWSSLVLTSGFTPPVTLEDVYELAKEALDLAQQALEAAWAGTEAASSVAYPALVTAWVGTATADVALSVAGAGTDLATVALERPGRDGACLPGAATSMVWDSGRSRHRVSCSGYRLGWHRHS